MQDTMNVTTGHRRTVITAVRPEIDGGRYPIKRVSGETVVVEADIFVDGHDEIAAVLRYRQDGGEWSETRMEALVNDRWRGAFRVYEPGRYEYTIHAWVDDFATGQHNLIKKANAGQDLTNDFLIGAALVQTASTLAKGADAELLTGIATTLKTGETDGARLMAALDQRLTALMRSYPDRRFASEYDRTLGVVVDIERARFSAWYEFFPRSTSETPGAHGTLKDSERMLPYVANMGFDVVYLPPIHPIGRQFRKGRNNAVVCEPGEPGSPWAIGGSEGGHTAVHPDLGTLDDFRHFVSAAHDLNLSVALDIAFQCSPDHPYVKDHPQWFRQRPDGTIQYAENPPKKYQDIYPFDFETEDWQALWTELTNVVLFWAEQGVHIFRIDNPHTKAFAFWEYLISTVKAQYPDAIFLAEAFTRPKVMSQLAKLGFSQSYTYFAWRHTKYDLTEYMTELTRTDLQEYFRPNFWPNTPDSLTEYLQTTGRRGFAIRLVLAATLAASYGIYGPAFELGEWEPREHGSEEYLNSEKYQIRQWDLTRADSLADLIGQVNRARRNYPALQTNATLRFHTVQNEALIAYSKTSGDDAVIVIVNLDPNVTQSGFLELNLAELGLGADQPFEVHDQLTGAHYRWQGAWQFVELNPFVQPAHVFHVHKGTPGD